MIATAQLHSLFLQCTGACTDTRQIVEGCMFFALKGPNFNANTFASEALGKGARYAVIDQDVPDMDERYIRVPDVLSALQLLAKHHRLGFDLPVIAITGSNGKTTTKELVHAVLNSDRPTLATIGNLNNHIGVPLTLLRLAGEHRVAIVEMGANKPGDIAELMAIAQPTLGLITNVGKAHLAGFGDFDGVVRTKTELYRFFNDHPGSLFVNADDPLLMAHSTGIERTTYGQDPSSAVHGAVVGNGPFLSIEFFGRDGHAHRADLDLIGAYNLHNALVAVAIGQHFGIPDERIAGSLTSYRSTNNRSQFSDTGRNQLIQDAYNANPTSMAAALRNFAEMTTDRPKLAILGDMLELGEESVAEHDAVVALVKRFGLDALFIGPYFSASIRDKGLMGYSSVEDLIASLGQAPPSGKLILLKGSRGIRLEKAVAIL